MASTIGFQDHDSTGRIPGHNRQQMSNDNSWTITITIYHTIEASYPCSELKRNPS